MVSIVQKYGLVTNTLCNFVAVTKTDTFSTATNGSWVDVTGLSISITPQLITSTILLFANIGMVGHSTGAYVDFQWATSAGSALLVGDAAGSRIRAAGATLGAQTAAEADGGYMFMATHAPASLAQQTYKIQLQASGGTSFVGRSSTDTDAASYARGACLLVAVEALT